MTEEKKQETTEETTSDETEVSTEAIKKELPDFRVGDTIRVLYKIIEGEKTRSQPYEGIVISKKGSDMSRTFTVRRIGADNIGVERIFPLNSPNIEDIKVLKLGKVRRAKLYYLRGKKGREATRIKVRQPKPAK